MREVAVPAANGDWAARGAAGTMRERLGKLLRLPHAGVGHTKKEARPTRPRDGRNTGTMVEGHKEGMARALSKQPWLQVPGVEGAAPSASNCFPGIALWVVLHLDEALPFEC